VNVFAHVAVAARAGGVDADDRFLLGAALSDLATFGGFRLLGRSPDDRITAGMAFHHRTDDAFHHHRWFRTRNRAAADALAGAGLPRGAARACAHVGVELLLDGALHRHADDRDRFARAVGTAPRLVDELGPLVYPERRPAWVAHLDELAAVVSERSLPPYDDPPEVAARLHWICGRRPRLAFDRRLIPAVTEELARHHPSIRTSAGDLVDELAAGLAIPRPT
jgi:hypothetical protein